MTTQITLLIRLLTAIHRLDDQKNDQLAELLGISYGADDADDAIQLLKPLRDLPGDVTERVRKYIEAAADFPGILAKNGVLASIPVIGKDPIELRANDVQRLLRAAGVLHVGAGKVRIGHPTKGVVYPINQTQRDVLRRSERIERQIREGLIPGPLRAEQLCEDSHPTPAEPHPTEQDLAHAHEVYNTYRSHTEPPEAAAVRAEYVADPSLAEELEAEGWNLPDAPLIDTDDAGRWAHEFTQTHPLTAEEGTMIGWFANAIETGKRIGAAQEKIRRNREDGEKLLKSRDASRDDRGQDRQGQDRQDRFDALMTNLRQTFPLGPSPLEKAATIILDLQDQLAERDQQ